MISINHAFVGSDPAACAKCGAGSTKHRKVPARVASSAKAKPRQRMVIGIDGEGHDLPDGRHVYTLLCAVNERGEVVAEAENPKGLSSTECFELLLSLPHAARKFIFMGSYDLTKMLEDLNPLDIWYIMHPDARRVRRCTRCKKKVVKPASVKCEDPDCGCETLRSAAQKRAVRSAVNGEPRCYDVEWDHGGFSVRRGRAPISMAFNRKTGEYVAVPTPSPAPAIKVWDCFKFFATSFVQAIEAWSIGTPEQHARILAMKKKRGAFAAEKPADVKRYCREECHLLALMMRKLLDACAEAGIKLERYDGPGSIANAMLSAHTMKEYLGRPLEDQPAGLRNAVMGAYFGGRFENAVVGAVNKPVHNHDIHSAYPYALSSLPCLEHGRWKRVACDVLTQARLGTLAVVRFSVRPADEKERAGIPWMPLPFRDASGSICYPTGFTGWAWLPEIEAALSGWPGWITLAEAWVYQTKCQCEPWAWMPHAYRKRSEWGSDGKGLVMKLGTNSCYGKTAQSAGEAPPYRSWIWAGMCTAITRAQVLAAVCTAKNRWNVLSVATDGIFTTEKLKLPAPRDTGTGDLKKPLGAWGRTSLASLFLVKPGMYFDETLQTMKARGVGRAELRKLAPKLMRAFARWDRRSELKIQAVSRRFYGARSSVLLQSRCGPCGESWVGVELCPKCQRVGTHHPEFMRLRDPRQPDRTKRLPAYGRWDERPIDIEFQCFPKREEAARGGSYGRLRVRDLGGAESAPYLGTTTPEGEAAREATEVALEEPDWHDD